MPPVEPNYTLKLEIEIAPLADRREIELYLRQYASELCADLGLPAGVSLSLNSKDRETFTQPGFFRISVNGQACRSCWWPQPNLPDHPSSQDIAALIGLALYDRREFLLTSELATLIVTEWKAPYGSDSTPRWSPGGFLQFLRTFLKYNFSLRHARRFLENRGAAGSPESNAIYLFEQALEEASDLAFGPAVAVCPEEQKKSEYAERFKSLMKNLSDDLGLISPEVRIEAGLLRPGEFQIQLNDIHLPVIRGLSRGEILLAVTLSDASKVGIETTQLFDPIAGYWLLCAEDSPEVKTKVSASQLGPADYLKESLSVAIVGNAGSLLVSPVVYVLIEHLKKSASNLIESVQKKFGESPPFHRRLTAILRQLLDEQVPIGDLADILESLLSLREVNHNGSRRVYHLSELPDSPMLVADDKNFADLSVGELAFAARTGVRSLSVRNQGKVRQTLPMLPLSPGLETAISSQCGAGAVSEEQAKQLADLLNAQSSPNCAIVVSQHCRAGIRDLLRFEFPTLPVFGSSEIPLSTLAEAYHTAARTFGAGKHYEEALEMLLKAASLQPEEAIYHYNLGRIYDILDRLTDADAEYHIAEQVANDPGWRAAIADTFYDRKAYEDAIRLYGEVAHESKKSYYFNRLGDSLYAVRAFCRAIEAYRQAILVAPKEAVCHANLAYALTSQGDYLSDTGQKRKHYGEAVDEFQRAITINRETAEYHYSLSRPLIKLHRMEQAAEELREAVRLDEKNVNARRELAACLSRQGKFAEAVQVLEASKEAYPSVLEIQLELARAYAQAGEYSQAMSLAEQIGGVPNPPKQATELLAALRNAQETAGKLSTEAENAVLFAALGHIHVQLGNLQAAVAQYRRAAALDPSNTEYYKWLGNTLFKEEEWEGAATEWEKAVGLAPDDALALNNLGTAYDNLEQNEKAMSCYKKASSLAPGKFVPQYNLGNSDYRLGNFEEARDAFQKAAEWNDKFSLARYHLGNCYYRLKQPDKATAEWQEAIRLDDKLVNAHFNLGVALWEAVDATGESQLKAVESWREALRLDRNLTAAEDNLGAYAQGREPDLAIFDLMRSR